MVGKIIKSGEGPAPSEPQATPSMARLPVPNPARRVGVVDAEEYSAHTKARDIIAQAEAQAAHIRAKAQADRDEVLAEAHEEGRQQGYAEMTEVLVKARLAHTALLHQAEPQIVKLSVKIAERIIGGELQTGEDALIRIVTRAIEQLRQSKELVLRLNPQDAELLRRDKRALLDAVGRVKDIAFRDDPQVGRGGCVIETESGTVDAQLSTQLEMIENLLLGEGE